MSVIVAVPDAPVGLLTSPVIDPVDSVKVSLASLTKSSVIPILNFTEVCPAAIVTGPDTVDQLMPPSFENSRELVKAVSVPTVAVPSLKVGVKLIVPVLALLRLTLKTA